MGINSAFKGLKYSLFEPRTSYNLMVHYVSEAGIASVFKEKKTPD